MVESVAVAIVGAGQAGFQVAASLRDHGHTGAIRIYGDEPYLPYQRPPLSKAWLKQVASPIGNPVGNPVGNRDGAPAPNLDQLTFRNASFYADKRIEIRTRTRVTAIDRHARTLTCAGGASEPWDQLVLATGVDNRRLPVPGAELPGVVMLRGIDDAHRIRERLARTHHVLIVGGGIIGLEVAALARGLGRAVDIVELGDRLVGRIGSRPLSEHLLHAQLASGAAVHFGASVTRFEAAAGELTAAQLSDGRTIATSLALVCIGVTPNTELAAAAGLTVQDGIVVDANMRSSDPAIYAIGDCSRFAPPHAASGIATVRLESVQNAIDQAKCAAETIVGRPRPYDALPWFWSDQGSLKLQIAGLVHGHDHTIVKADPATTALPSALTVFCFARDRLLGVECVNHPADFMAARRLLAARRTISIAELESHDFELRKLLA